MGYSKKGGPFTMEISIMKQKNRIFIFILSIASFFNCFGMNTEHQIVVGNETNRTIETNEATTLPQNNVVKEKKSLIFSQLKIETDKTTLFELPGGIKASNTELKIATQSGKSIAKSHYVSFEGITSINEILLTQAMSLLPQLSSWVPLEHQTTFTSAIEGFKQIQSAISRCSSIVYIGHLSIDPEYRNQQLGQKLGAFIFLEIMKQHLNSMLCWVAVPLDDRSDKDLKQRLYKFYRSFGATVREDLGGFSWIDTRKYASNLAQLGFKSKL